MPNINDQGTTSGRLSSCSLDHRRIAVIFVAFFGITVAPVIFTPVPPLVDYPNHLAFLHVLVNHSESPFLQRYYDPNISFNENMGLVIGALPLAALFGAEIGLKLFTITTILLLTSGVLVLHRTVHQRWSVVPFSAFVLVYNRAFLWGLLSFHFAVALAIWSLAGWIKARHLSYWARSSVAAAGALILGLTHLYGFAVFLLAVGGHELARLYRAGKLRSGRAWLEAVAAALPLLAPLLIIPFTDTHSFAVGELQWRSIGGRLEQWAAPFLAYNPGLDAVAAGLLAALVLFLLINRNLTFGWPLVGGLVLLMLMQMVMPEVIGGTSMADRRIPAVWFLLLVAAVDVRAPWRIQLASIVIVTLVLLVRVASVTQHWHDWGKQYREYGNAFRIMPRGAKLLGGTVHPNRLAWVSDPRLHAEAYAVLTSDAFVGSLFADPVVPGQHLAYRPSYASLARASMDLVWIEPDQVRDSDRFRLLAPCYDYVLVNAPARIDLLPTTGYAEVFRGRGFRLFRRSFALGRHSPCPN